MHAGTKRVYIGTGVKVGKLKLMSTPQRRFGLPCPHCGSTAPVRTSRQISLVVSEAYHACSNIEHCGATFATQTTIVRMLSPSNSPNPRVHLPQAPPRAPMRKGQPAGDNDNYPTPANDNPLIHAAEA